MSTQSRRFVHALAWSLFASSPAWALRAPGTVESTPDPRIMQIDEPRYLGALVPRGIEMLGASGRAFTLGDVLGKPVILLLSYYQCDGSCSTMNRALYRELPKVERFRIGRDYRVLTVSFDRNDTAARAAEFARQLELPAAIRAGWTHAVVRDRQNASGALASSVGFRYFWSQADRAFLHPNVLVFLTPEGRVARYLYGTHLDARQIGLALVDADWGRISNSANVIDLVTGVCFSYNYAEGKYQPNYSLLAGAGALLFGVSLMVSGAVVYRNRQRRMSNVSNI